MKTLLLMLPIAAVLSFGTGCKSVNVVDSQTRAILLKDTHTRTSKGVNKISFPAGVYSPDFQTAEGVYYRASAKLTCHSLGMINQVLRGGLFLPNALEKDQRQAAWFDHQESGGGLIGFAASAPTRLFRFREPIPFEPISGKDSDWEDSRNK